MSRSDYILWLGGVFDREAMLTWPAIVPAAWRWQSGLLGGLCERGVEVHTIGHAPEPAWPRGRVRVTPPAPHPRFPAEPVRYWNLPGLRTRDLGRRYTAAVDRVIAARGVPMAVLSFNAYRYNMQAGLHAQRRGIAWVPVVADVPSPGPNLARHDRGVAAAAGRVYLSWGSFARDGGEPKLHLDGGVAGIDGGDPAEATAPVILYTGSLGRWGGVDALLAAFGRLRRPDAQLWVCGKGDGERIDQAAKADPRIRFFGLVPEERLRALTRAASVLVNPRPAQLPSNAQNFPSKILEYLSYCKPVVSTWTDGLAPEYRRVLVVVDGADPDRLAAALDDVLGWDAHRRTEHARVVRRFLEGEKTWSRQAERLLEWLGSRVPGARVVGSGGTAT